MAKQPGAPGKWLEEHTSPSWWDTLVGMSRGSGLRVEGKALELPEPQLLCLLNGNERFCVMKVHPGQTVALAECLAYRKHLLSGSCHG